MEVVGGIGATQQRGTLCRERIHSFVGWAERRGRWSRGGAKEVMRAGAVVDELTLESSADQLSELRWLMVYKLFFGSAE